MRGDDRAAARVDRDAAAGRADIPVLPAAGNLRLRGRDFRPAPGDHIAGGQGKIFLNALCAERCGVQLV